MRIIQTEKPIAMEENDINIMKVHSTSVILCPQASSEEDLSDITD